MVKVIENWARLEGTVRGVSPTADLAGWADLLVEVRTSEDEEGFPNLLADAAGRTVPVTARQEAASRVAVGDVVRLRARRASPTRVFADSESIERVGT